MKRVFSLVILFLFLTACGQGESEMPTAVPPAPTIVPPTATTPVDTPTPIPPTLAPLPTATTLPRDLSIQSHGVRFYPVGNIYSGDLVTFQLLPFVPDNVAGSEVTVHVLVDGVEVVNAALDGRNLGGTVEGLFPWVWDTSLAEGEYEVEVILDRDDRITEGDEIAENNVVSVTVTVLDESLQPAGEANAEWLKVETDCCIVHAISGTSAGRDFDELVEMVETAVQEASDTLREPIQTKFEVYFIDKVIGQGGYASGYMVISYLDRNYAGNGLYNVLVHEASHVIDRQFAPQRVIMLTEGLAVWVSGGHFKPDELNQRAAAILSTGNYVPLGELVSDFYNAQHESSYSQAAGFVTYLIQTYSWPSFRAFYADTAADDASTLTEALNLNLQAYYGKSLDEMEAEWLAYLEGLPPNRAQATDVVTTIRFFEVMRRYQKVYDPTAYFRTAWLPSPPFVRDQGNTADLTRTNVSDTHIALETMLLAADTAVRDRDYDLANILLDSVTRVLDGEGTFIDPLAVNYLNIVRETQVAGYEAHQIDLRGTHAEVIATRPNRTTLTKLQFDLSGGEWTLSN